MRKFLANVSDRFLFLAHCYGGSVWEAHWRSAPGDSLNDAIPFNDDPAAGVILSLCLRIEYGSRMTDP